jgi:large subunit ribosomal protein L19
VERTFKQKEKMKNIEDINKAQIEKLTSKKKITSFFPGDTIRVGVRIADGKRERIQNFEGVCIAKKNRDINSSFTVRKISFGEGVERTFALYSPIIGSIKVIRSGKVRRAKLYYLRDRKGKSARIAEKLRKNIGVDVEVKSSVPGDIKQDTSIAEEKETSKVEAKKEESKKEEAVQAKKIIEKTTVKEKDNLK